jgi:hypothetical protein
MVQVIKTENHKGKLAESLGLSLGQGIGNGLNTYFANRSLDSVMHDKSLDGKSYSEKLEATRAALSPYGEKGQEILQQRMQIMQMDKQEQDVKKAEAKEKIKGKALGKYLKGGELTEDEESMFTPQEFVAMHKARNPKPQGGVTGQPLSPDKIQAIENVIRQNPDVSSDDLAIAMGKAGIEPIYSNPYIENRRRQEETNAKNANEANKIANKEDILFHQESSEFEKGVTKNASVARKQIPLIETNIKNVKEGKIKPHSLANIFSALGERGKKIANALLSGEEAALNASIPEFLEGRKELFGVRLSDADLKLLEDKLPHIGKSKEANLAILDLMKRAAQRALQLEKVSQDVLEKKGVQRKGGKLRPLGYEREVMKAFDEANENEGIFEDVPSAAEYPNKIIEDDSGKRYKSNGQTWEPV